MKGGFRQIVNSPSKTLIAFCFCFILGVIACSIKDFSKDNLFYLFIFIWAILFLLIFTSKSRLSFPRRRESRFVLLCLLFFTLGVASVLLFQPDITPEHIAYYNGTQQEFIGRVIEEPDVRINKTYYILSVILSGSEESLNHERDSSPAVQNDNIGGRVRITTLLYPRYEYGDVLQIKCKLQKPEAIEGFRYDKFLVLQKVYSVCYYPTLKTHNLELGTQGYSIGSADGFFKNLSLIHI